MSCDYNRLALPSDIPECQNSAMRRMGEAIRAERKAAPRWTQKQLARQAGVNSETVSAAENNKNSESESLRRIAHALAEKATSAGRAIPPEFQPHLFDQEEIKALPTRADFTERPPRQIGQPEAPPMLQAQDDILRRIQGLYADIPEGKRAQFLTYVRQAHAKVHEEESEEQRAGKRPAAGKM